MIKRVRCFATRCLLSLLFLCVLARSSAAESFRFDVGHSRSRLGLSATADAARLSIRACEKPPCQAGDRETVLNLDGRIQENHFRAEAIRVGSDEVLLVESRPRDGEGYYAALLAAPRRGEGQDPKILFEGTLDKWEGSPGERRKHVLLREKAAKESLLYLAEQRESVTLCGRPVHVAIRRLNASEMVFERGGTYQSLPEKERAESPLLSAEPFPDGSAVTPLLVATLASSSKGESPRVLTDQSLETAWHEARHGRGRGEFVLMNSAEAVPINGFAFAARGTGSDTQGEAARSFFVVTDGSSFRVEATVASSAKQGQYFKVQLPNEVRTRCVALVLDEAGAEDVDIVFSEFAALTRFDGKGAAELANDLSGDSHEASAVAALLRKQIEKPDVLTAVRSGYSAMSAEGRGRARNILESARCESIVGFVLDRFSDGASRSEEREWAQAETRRCAKESKASWAQSIREAPLEAALGTALEFARAVPEEAVPLSFSLIQRILKESPPDRLLPHRKSARAVLRIALRNERARAELTKALGAPWIKEAPSNVLLDVLFAMDTFVCTSPVAIDLGERLMRETLPFGSRYRLFEPALALARCGHRGAIQWIRSGLVDPDPKIRGRAALSAVGVTGLERAVMPLLRDGEPRVRRAALEALRSRPLRELSPVLLDVLLHDPWTYVRVQAAETLGTFSREPEVDDALAEVLGDPSSLIRQAVIRSLGSRKAKLHADEVRERAEDAAEVIDVRVEALKTLGTLCDEDSADDLTRYALRLANPIDDVDRRIGAAALQALTAIHPSDLQERISPLLSKQTSAAVREAASQAVKAPGTCFR